MSANKTTIAFDNFSKNYDLFMNKTKHNKAKNKIFEKVKKYIYGNVLDVATGTGYIANKIFKKMEHVFSFDTSQTWDRKPTSKEVGIISNRIVSVDADSIEQISIFIIH